MKITKEYLKTIIREELYKLEEGTNIDPTVDQKLKADITKNYAIQSDQLDAAQGILGDITDAANNPNLSDEQIAQLLNAKGVKQNPLTDKLKNAQYTRDNMSGNPKDPKTRIAKAISKIK